MYTLRMSHGYVDEPETWTIETLGTYANREDAAKAAEDKFLAALVDACDEGGKECLDEVECSRYDYYVTYGDYDCELGRVFAGYNHFFHITVLER